MAMTGLSSIGGIAAALAISIAGPASVFSLDLRGIYCQREAEHSIGSDEDETFVVVTVFDNRTGALLAGPEPLPLDRQGRPTYWPDVDAGEFRPWGHRVWSGGARDLLIDVQTWEYDDHLRGALQAIFTVSSGLGAGLITKNPIVGLKATAAAKEVGDAVFGELKD